MLNAIIAGQGVGLNPILRAPSQLFAQQSIAVGATTSGAVNSALQLAADVRATQSTSTNANLLNVTGKGVLLFCAFNSGANVSTCIGTITIDGVVVFNAVACPTNSLICPVGIVSAIDVGLSTSTVTLEAVPFNASCLIQYRAGTNGNTVGAACKYRLTN